MDGITLERLFEFVGNHLYLVIAFVVVTVLLIRDLAESLLRKYKVVTPLQAVMLINNEDAVVLDVREPHEWVKGHVADAVLISVGDLDKKLGELEPYRERPIIVTCQSGNRSITACRKLVAAGFPKVYLMKGGMTAWEEAGLPVVKSKQSE